MPRPSPFLIASLTAALGGCLADDTDQAQTGETAQAAAGESPDKRWSSRTVAFRVDRSAATGFSSAVADFIEETVLGLNDDGTPMTFVKYSSTPPGDYIFYTADPTISGGTTKRDSGNPGAKILLGTSVINGPGAGAGTIRHETGHALGLTHEHKRPDRDQYVFFDCDCYDPNPNNSDDDEPGCDANGDPLLSFKGTDPFGIEDDLALFTPYDYDSVMHYGPANYAKPGCQTLSRLDGGSDADLGNPQFSAEDRNALWQMYEPALGDNEAGDQLGAAMVSADFDGDGYEDLAVGAPGERPGSGAKAGVVFLYKGTYANGLVPWQYLKETDFVGATARDGDRFGAALAARDMNDDGKAELFVGAPDYQPTAGVAAGAVFYYRGDTHDGLRAETDFLTQSDDGIAGAAVDEHGDDFGAALAVVVRGFGDKRFLAIGAPGEEDLGKKSGYVSVFRWAAGHLTAWTGFNNAGFSGGAGNGDLFGYALAAGDFDGDALTDLAVGAPSAGSTDAGKVYVFGADDPSDSWIGEEMLPASTLDPGDFYGAAVAAGDLDNAAGDRRELIVGAPGRVGGRVYTYRNDAASTAPIDMTSIETLGGSTVDGDELGAALAVGDSNGDGRADLAVGLPAKSVGASHTGQVRVYLGEPAGTLDLVLTYNLQSGQSNDTLGRSVAFGNVDNNHFGWDALVVGAPGRGGNAGAIQTFVAGFLVPYRYLDQETWTWR